MSKIPFVDLQAQFESIRPDVLGTIEKVIEKGAFIQGEYVRNFEQKFGRALSNSAHCIGCSNGTTALFMALEALGISAGDEVITTPMTFIATAEAISHTGAKPVFADVDPRSGNIDPQEVKKAITPRTKAVIAVHLYGNPCDMDAIKEAVRGHDIKIVEDSAQSHFATYKGKMTGTLSDAGSFSFYPGKNLGAYGDAGAVVTNDPITAFKIKQLVDHGRTEKYLHEVVGYNNRLDGLQAAVLDLKLNYIKQWTEKRRQLAARYNTLLGCVEGIRIPETTAHSESAYHLYTIHVAERDLVKAKLEKAGIQVGIHYPIPLHLQPAYAGLGYKAGDFPHSEYIASNSLSLPIYPELTFEQQDKVCAVLRESLQ